MTAESVDPTLDELTRRINAQAAQAYQRFQELLADGLAPRDAMETVRVGFEGQYFTQLSAAFDKALDQRWPVQALRTYPVGDVTLSQALYANWQETERVVSSLVERNARALQQARVVAMQLYTGYGLKPGEVLNFGQARIKLLPVELRELAKDKKVRDVLQVAAGRARAATLKTAALQSAYMQAFEAQMSGVAEAKLDRLLKVAMEEKVRYFANRIAQTELARAHALVRANELMSDETISVVQWRLSGTHPEPDICDIIAKTDRWGLGPGCFPKAKAPRPIAHPHCRCRLRSRPDLSDADAVERPNAEQEYLDQFPDWEAARQVGSKAKLARVKAGEDTRDVFNEGKIERHQVPLLGDGGPEPIRPPGATPPPAPPAPPAPVAPQFPIPAFVPQTTVAAAARFAQTVLNAPGPVAYAKADSGMPAIRFRHNGTKTSAEVRSKRYGQADWKGLDAPTANFINNWLIRAAAEADRIGIPRLRGVNTAAGAGAGASMGDGVLAVNKRQRVDLRGGDALVEARRRQLAGFGNWKAADGNLRVSPKDPTKSIRNRPSVSTDYFVADEERLENVLWHEFAHHIHQQLGVVSSAEYVAPPLEAVLQRAWVNAPAFPSQYAAVNSKEYFAECFALWKMGRVELVPDFMLKIIETVDTGVLPK